MPANIKHALCIALTLSFTSTLFAETSQEAIKKYEHNISAHKSNIEKLDLAGKQGVLPDEIIPLVFEQVKSKISLSDKHKHIPLIGNPAERNRLIVSQASRAEYLAYSKRANAFIASHFPSQRNNPDFLEFITGAIVEAQKTNTLSKHAPKKREKRVLHYLTKMRYGEESGSIQMAVFNNIAPYTFQNLISDKTGEFSKFIKVLSGMTQIAETDKQIAETDKQIVKVDKDIKTYKAMAKLGDNIEPDNKEVEKESQRK